MGILQTISVCILQEEHFMWHKSIRAGQDLVFSGSSLVGYEKSKILLFLGMRIR